MTSSPESDAVSETALPTFADVREAAERLKGPAVRTPLLESPALNARLGGRLLVKPEMLQRTGSFKFRGAYNRISRLSGEDKRRGIVAYSSGNHAQGVAAAAQVCQVPATIVMPSDAPAIKIDNTRGYGAEVVLYDRARESREEVAARIAAEKGAQMVRPYDDFHIIAGQGTAGLELAEQAAEMGARLDAVLIPCSGGGLTAGTALALEALSPETEIYVVEPAGFDDTVRSLAAGRRLPVEGGARTFCDGLIVPIPGELTFPINRRRVAGGFVLGDDDTAKGIAAAFRHLKLVAEPSGAIALAAVATGRFDAAGRTVAVICSGGNVDPDTFCRALDRAGA